MTHYGIDEPSVNNSKVTVRVACPTCGEIETGNIVAESLENMTRRPDGVYVDEVECAECMTPTNAILTRARVIIMEDML